MKRMQSGSHAPIYLGVEAGATRTWARLEQGDPGHSHSIQAEFGPANVRLLTDAQLTRHFRTIARALTTPSAIAIGMAGARTEADRERIQKAAAIAWPGVPCYATNDLETALMAAEDLAKQRPFRPGTVGRRADRNPIMPRVLVLSGTGSCCFGRAEGRTAKVGGWGQLLGDKGSGYEIGLRGMKAVVHYYDRDGRWPKLGRQLLQTLMLNEPDELIGWAHRATKDQVAALALEVFKAWRRRDPIATDILEGAAHSLASDAAACARRLADHKTKVHFVLAGGVLLNQPRFGRWVARELRKRWRNGIVTRLEREGVRGALLLAKQHFSPVALQVNHARRYLAAERDRAEASSFGRAAFADASALAQSITEQRNLRSMNLDKLPPSKAIALMLREEATVPRSLLTQRRRLEQGLRLIVHSFRRGGRLFYVGAGTSGRLGVLDASECPPTFRTDPEMVQGIMAGGARALWESVEGAEDDSAAGARAVEFRGVNQRDTVVGIAASGRTPFVWGALRKAKQRGATTILLCFNPAIAIPDKDRPTLVIAPEIGPEVLTGSTRLKAGTATKLVLNIFTTLAMVRLGKVRSNLMIDVKPSNTKLRDRAARIVQALSGTDYDVARAALERTNWEVKQACALLRRKQDRV